MESWFQKPEFLPRNLFLEAEFSLKLTVQWTQSSPSLIPTMCKRLFLFSSQTRIEPTWVTARSQYPRIDRSQDFLTRLPLVSLAHSWELSVSPLTSHSE